MERRSFGMMPPARPIEEKPEENLEQEKIDKAAEEQRKNEEYQKLKVLVKVCLYCNKEFERMENVEVGGLSRGICPGCKPKAMEAMGMGQL